MRRHHLLRAFTLIELMVVIVIISMLAALLIPAIQRAREADRSAATIRIRSSTRSCNSPRRKTGCPYLATTLPGKAPATGSTNYVTAGWVPQILAHLGRNDLYDIYSNNATAGGSVFNANGKATGPAGNAFIQYLDLLVCPSDTEKPTTFVAPTTVNATAQAPLSYAVNAGFTDIKPCTAHGITYPPDYVENGVFFNQAASAMFLPVQGPPDDIQQTPITVDSDYIAKHDGTATTILFGENMDATFWAQCSANSQAPVSFVPSANYSSSSLNPRVDAVICPTNSEDAQALTWQDLPDIQDTATPEQPPTIGLNQGYNGLQPGQIAQLIGTNSEPPQGAVARPSSAHPGGFLMTFCDGHTMFMSQDVSYQIYAELMTPCGKYARIPGSGPYVQGSAPTPHLQTWQTAPISAASLSP